MAPWDHVVHQGMLDMLDSARFDALRVAQQNDPSYQTQRDADDRRLLERLLACPLVRRQPRMPYRAADYARSLTEAFRAYQQGNTATPFPLRFFPRPPWAGAQDLVEAVGLAGGDLLSRQCNVPLEMACLRAIVQEARIEGHPLSLSEVMAIALRLDHGNVAAGLKLAAMTLKNVVRAPAFLLQYAHDRHLDPRALGLELAGTRFSGDLGIGFMARFVADPSGEAYGLDRTGPAPTGEWHRLAMAEDLVGIPYHNLEVLRLVAVNSLLPPRAVGPLVSLYYSPAARAIGYSTPQSQEKRRQDDRAFRGAMAFLGGRAGGTAFVSALRWRESGQDVAWRTACRLLSASIEQLSAHHLRLPEGTRIGPLAALRVLPSGDLTSDGYPSRAWREGIARIGGLPWTPVS